MAAKEEVVYFRLPGSPDLHPSNQPFTRTVVSTLENVATKDLKLVSGGLVDFLHDQYGVELSDWKDAAQTQKYFFDGPKKLKTATFDEWRHIKGAACLKDYGSPGVIAPPPLTRAFRLTVGDEKKAALNPIITVQYSDESTETILDGNEDKKYKDVVHYGGGKDITQITIDQFDDQGGARLRLYAAEVWFVKRVPMKDQFSAAAVKAAVAQRKDLEGVRATLVANAEKFKKEGNEMTFAGLNQMTPVTWIQQIPARSSAVALIRIPVYHSPEDRKSNRPAGFVNGTGFMISDTLMVTADHVLRPPKLDDDEQPDTLPDDQKNDRAFRVNMFDDVGVFFGFNGGDQPAGPPCKLDEKTAYIFDYESDFAVVAIKPSSVGAAMPDFTPITINPNVKHRKFDPVNIIHHPAGLSKKLSVRGVAMSVQDGKAHQVHYRTDTKKGSSGAPLFNDNWDLVGIHQAADKDQKASNPTADLGTTSEVVGTNRGLRIDDFLKKMKAKDISFYNGRIATTWAKGAAAGAANGAAPAAAPASASSSSSASSRPPP